MSENETTTETQDQNKKDGAKGAKGAKGGKKSTGKKPEAPKKAEKGIDPRAALLGKPVLVRTNCQGIYFGYWNGYRVEPYDPAKMVEGYTGPKHPRHIISLKNARRVWEMGNQSFQGLTEVGPTLAKKGGTSKILEEQELVELVDKNFARPTFYVVAEVEEKAEEAFLAADVFEHE